MNYADVNGDGEVYSTEILEENNYYPFGLRHKGYNELATENPAGFKYKFGGKELNDELGFEVYDFGARNYDPALGRWMNIDPLAEEMRRFSPYNYAFNNPVFFIDPDGMAPFGFDKSKLDELKPIVDINETLAYNPEPVGMGLEDDYGIDKDGKITLLKNTDDKFDRLFELDKKGNIKKRGNSFLISKAKRGQEIVAVDNIAKGILKDGMNLKENNTVFKVNGEGQPTLAEFDNFISRFSDYLKKEIAGVRLGSDLSPDVNSVRTYSYKGNDRFNSAVPDSWIENGYNGRVFGNQYLKAHFHTHPYGDHTPSPKGDVPLRSNHKYKNLPFYIIAGGYEKPF